MTFQSKIAPFLGVLLPFFILGQVAHAEVAGCIFRKTVAFGASVTQATPTVIPGYRAFVAGVETYGNYFGNYSLPKSVGPLQKYNRRPYGPSPVDEVVRKYGGDGAARRVSYIGSYFNSSEASLGSAQIQSLLLGENSNLFGSASALIGVDAFYWDAIVENCGYGHGLGVEPIISNLIRAAKAQNKVLILGNVPHENPANVRIDSDRTGVEGLWYAPNPICANSINQTLARECLPENGCYIVDLKGTTDALNCGEKLPLSKGGTYSLFELRPDGVHMSDKGASYIAELIMKALESNPPTCLF